MSETDTLDKGALERLQEWGGDKLLAQMIRLFLENAPNRMAQIQAGVSSGDIKEAERGSHSLKSSAANVGALRVRDLSADIERAAGAGDSETVNELFSSLETAFAEAISALEAVEKGLNA